VEVVRISTLTVRNLDPEITDAIKALGVEHGRSMEAEARVLLAEAVGKRANGSRGLAARIHARFAELEVEDGWADDLRPRDAATWVEFKD
jgi:plasmid stability protein